MKKTKKTIVIMAQICLYSLCDSFDSDVSQMPQKTKISKSNKEGGKHEIS